MFADKELITTTLAKTDCPSPSTQAKTNNYGTTEILATEKHNTTVTTSYARKYKILMYSYAV